MKYYIVATFDDKSYEKLNPIQKKISKKFRANRNSPVSHIILNIVENPNIDKLEDILKKTLKPYKRFKVQVSNDILVSDSLKNITLKTQNLGYIKKIEREFSDTLELSGFNFKNIADDNFGISIANINYINKDRKNDLEALSLDQFTNKDDNLTMKISKFEIWRQTNNKKDLCVKSFPLKLF